MKCLHCKDLTRMFEFRLAGYVKACNAPFYAVSTELAASKLVDMERAKNDLEEHRWACTYPERFGVGKREADRLSTREVLC